MTIQDIDRSTFEADWADWHRRHEELRAGPHGFLAITGRHWLTEEPQRFEDAPGAWSATGDSVTVILDDGEELAVDGEPVHGTYRFAPIPERGQVNATAGDAVIEVARRGGHMIVRPRHPGHPTRTGYPGTAAYAPDPRWVIEGRYLPYDEPRDVTVGAVVEGLQHVYAAPGEIEFAVDGQTLRLIAFNGYKPGSLGVLFTDATSGVTTYPANRSLQVAAPRRTARSPSTSTVPSTCPAPTPSSPPARCRPPATASRSPSRPARSCPASSTRRLAASPKLPASAGRQRCAPRRSTSPCRSSGPPCPCWHARCCSRTRAAGTAPARKPGHRSG